MLHLFSQPGWLRSVQKMDTDLMFSSKNMTWATPWSFFKKLDNEFFFNLDVCALPENTKCTKYYSPAEDGLSQRWKGTCWMNPPYGRAIKQWIAKAHEESLSGSTVVCLIPSRTDTKYWHDYCMNAAEIRFVKGRLKFGDGSNSAPFPSAVIIFNDLGQDLKISAIDA